MELNDRVTQLENEIKILKSEIQVVLLDLRENCLDRENPFTLVVASDNSPRETSRQPPALADKAEPASPTPQQPPENGDGALAALEESTNELELTNQAKPINEPVSVASEEAAHEEVIKAWRPEIARETNPNTRKAFGEASEKIDLTVITELARWVTEAVKRLGHEKTEAILNIAEMIGHLAPELKNILVQFIKPTPTDNSGRATTQDYLAVIMELGSLLGRDNKSEVALLYMMLCQENDHR